jgi:hypothetical protein
MPTKDPEKLRAKYQRYHDRHRTAILDRKRTRRQERGALAWGAVGQCGICGATVPTVDGHGIGFDGRLCQTDYSYQRRRHKTGTLA